ncbi:Chitinase [Enhygromyxa salina]|uniref:Chitinase n=1 Tax=Enhygromyxa salina TaxID=215803 RepID=A0A0C2D1V9_9BACT|nr:hypothetical protein [Enhygromyxa salina]KIG17196.1 Chitinase [Enhygromyxa salina]
MISLCEVPGHEHKCAAEDESTESSGDGDGDGDPGDGDGDPGDGDGDGDDNGLPPVIDAFTINGSGTPAPIEVAGAAKLLALASDPDGDLVRVEFQATGQLLGSVSGAGPDFELEWLISGAENNDSHTVTAVAYDAKDNASAPIMLELGVAMPDGGGEVDQWIYDGGLLDAVYDVAVSPDGDQVLLVGQTSTMNGSGQRVDRVVGPLWADKVKTDSVAAAGVVWSQGTFVVAGSLFANMALDTALYDFDAGGTIAQQWVFDGSRPELGNPEIIDTPNGLERDSTGRLYVIGTYSPLSGPQMGITASFLLAVTPNGDQEWLRWPTQDPNIEGSPVLTELAVSSTDALATVGTRDVGGPRMWVSRWNSDGQLTSEHEVGDGTASEGHAIAFAEDDSLYIGGGVVANGEVKSWMRKLDAQDNELWTAQPMHVGRGVTAGIAVDPWGEVVTVSTQACSQDGDSLTDCELVVRKYDAKGTLMWFEIWDTENFVGPVANLPGFDASLAIDRFGYIYVTAVVYNGNTGTDWWARKLHP